MPHDALRTILPIAGWPAERADCSRLHRRHRPRAAHTVPHRRCRHRDPGRDRACRRRPVGDLLWKAPERCRRSAPGHGILAQRPLHEARRRECLGSAQFDHGRLSHQGWPLELSALQFSKSSRRGTRRARRCGRSRSSRARRAELERRRPGRGDHRRQGRRWHGADARRNGRGTRRLPRSQRCL